MELSPQQRTELLNLARNVIRATLSHNPLEFDTPTDPPLRENAGAFVSLHEMASHRLRGCVGRLDASQPLFQAIATAAQSVLDDPRFTTLRVTLGDLPNLEIEISITWPLRPTLDMTDFD